ncbi:hypothetical protein Tco_0379631, partial [Tanacetum coccineum]
ASSNTALHVFSSIKARESADATSSPPLSWPIGNKMHVYNHYYMDHKLKPGAWHSLVPACKGPGNPGDEAADRGEGRGRVCGEEELRKSTAVTKTNSNHNLKILLKTTVEVEGWFENAYCQKGKNNKMIGGVGQLHGPG